MHRFMGLPTIPSALASGVSSGAVGALVRQSDMVLGKVRQSDMVFLGGGASVFPLRAFVGSPKDLLFLFRGAKNRA